jgi:molybdopterin-guanine dinucleotide biosynthesis protein B
MPKVTDLCSVPVLGFVAASGTGKTTLLTRLIPALRERGLRCAVIKHSHHDVEIDRPGKDSHRLREAGAGQVILASPHRIFWVQEGDGVSEPRLADLLGRLDSTSLDLILVEGFRSERLPKIEIHRPVLGAPLLCAEDPDIIALASDDAVYAAPARVPLLALNRPVEVAEFIVSWLQTGARHTRQTRQQ